MERGATKVWDCYMDILENNWLDQMKDYDVNDLRHRFMILPDDALDLKNLIQTRIKFPVPTTGSPKDPFVRYMMATVHDCGYEGWNAQERIDLMKVWYDYNLFKINGG